MAQIDLGLRQLNSESPAATGGRHAKVAKQPIKEPKGLEAQGALGSASLRCEPVLTGISHVDASHAAPNFYLVILPRSRVSTSNGCEITSEATDQYYAFT
jgi:hypothetical protein